MKQYVKEEKRKYATPKIEISAYLQSEAITTSDIGGTEEIVGDNDLP